MSATPPLRGLLVLGSLVVLAYLAAFAEVWRFPSDFDGRPAEAMIVLGAAAYGKRPSPIFEGRLRGALALYAAGAANRIILTGGVGRGDSISEAAVGRAFLKERGVPETALRLEQTSRTTATNLRNAADIARAHGWRDVLIVSDGLHLRRAVRMARDLGLCARPAATAYGRLRSRRVRLAFALREAHFLLVYRLAPFLSQGPRC